MSKKIAEYLEKAPGWSKPFIIPVMLPVVLIAGVCILCVMVIEALYEIIVSFFKGELTL